MTKPEGYKALIFFVIKISFLVGIYYYFSGQINSYAIKPDFMMASAFSGGYAAVILLIILTFRWSGFFSRILAGLCATAALGLVIGLHILYNGFDKIAFISTYLGIVFLAILLGYAILFKKI
ncbi:hypothetical protein MNBD_GAMMA12-427 [hydrothermal vent metagenome]|uniref:Uncharacterized protein n=1 Tax=hydrothermal vent metagenome TaxID=652676 RepID=A0A3B0YII9_9ZZZZ